MRIRVSVIMVLMSLILTLVPQPAQAAGLTMTPVQGIVGSEVTIVNIASYGTGEYQIYWGDDKQLIAQGILTPSCSLASMSVEAAESTLQLLAELSAKIRGKYTV